MTVLIAPTIALGLVLAGILWAVVRVAARRTLAWAYADQPDPGRDADHEAAVEYAQRIEGALAALGDDSEGHIRVDALDGAHVAGYLLGLIQAGSNDVPRAVSDTPSKLLPLAFDAALRNARLAPRAPGAADVVEALRHEIETRADPDVRLDEDCEAVVDAFWGRGLDGVRDIATQLPTPRLRAVARQSARENRTAPSRSTRLAMARITEALLAEAVARDHGAASVP